MIRKMRMTAMLLTLVVALFATVPQVYADSAVLQKGDQGSDVQEMQARLKKWGYYHGSIDSLFGSQTEQSVEFFQQRNDLKVDGVVGDQTADAIGITISDDNQSSGSKYSAAELNLLAKAVYAESRGEPYEGQVAVAAVILNRVKSPQFPNTLTGVIYQPNAFSSVHDGQINLTPNSTAVRAAQEALNGADPSKGALYFYNPAISTSSWIFSRKVTTVIGHHRFCV